MNIQQIIGTVIVEEIVKEIWRQATNEKSPKGSMYPFELPEESKAKIKTPVPREQSPPRKALRTDIHDSVVRYLASPAVQNWQNQFSHVLDKTYVERPGGGYNMQMERALQTLKASAVQEVMKRLGLA